MAAQTISLSATFAEAARLGIPAARFTAELVEAARASPLPATAGRWMKVKLDFSPGDTLDHAVHGTSLHPLLESLQRQEASLRKQKVSHHWHCNQYHTLLFTGRQWLLYYVSEDSGGGAWPVHQSYWDMSVHIDKRRWCILFEDVDNNHRYEAEHVDFDLRRIKEIWNDIGPDLNNLRGRPPEYIPEKEQATNWVRTNPFAQAVSFRDFVQSLRPHEIIPKETMRRVFMPIYRANTLND